MIYDDELEGTFKQVGPILSVYRAPVWRLRVGFAVMLLIGIGMVSTAFFAVWPPGTNESLGLLIVGLGSLAVALWIMVYHVKSRHRRIFVCVDGIVVDDGAHCDYYGWGDVVRVQEEKQTDFIHILPIGTYRAAYVEFADESRLFLDRNRIRRVGQLIDDIQKAIWPRRHQAQMASMDVDLARIVAEWPNLSKNERARILSIVDGSDSTSVS